MAVRFGQPISLAREWSRFRARAVGRTDERAARPASVRTLARRVLQLLVPLAILLTSWPAFAFRTATDDPAFSGTQKVKREGSQIRFGINGDVPVGISKAEVEKAADTAFGRWSAAEAELTIGFDGWTDDEAVAGDGVNTLQFVSTGWSDRGFDDVAPGITDVSYSQNARGDWVIAEADIYLNADTHAWIVSGRGEGDERDLDSVLTHEAGHFLGLWHPCEIAGAQGAPDCESDSSFAEATMFPVYSSAQSSLARDDIAAIKFLYGATSCAEQGCPDGSTCSSEGCVTQCGAAVCSPHERCTADGCWPDDKCYGVGCEQRCAVDADCGDGLRCITSRCSGTTPPGDPCSEAANCESLLCANGDFCLASCTDCLAGECAQTHDSGRTCETNKLPIGASCEAPEDCAGGECLTGAEKANVCTRVCREGGPICPDRWSCIQVDEAQVCVPERVEPRGGSGCSIAVIPEPNAWLFSLSLLLVKRRAKRRHLKAAEGEA